MVGNEKPRGLSGMGGTRGKKCAFWVYNKQGSLIANVGGRNWKQRENRGGSEKNRVKRKFGNQR